MSPRVWWLLAASMLAVPGLLVSSANGAQALRDLPAGKLEGADSRAGQPPSAVVTRLSDPADLDARSLSLTFPKPAPVRDVVLLLVRGTPLSAVLERSVTGTFTGELRGLTIRQALEAVLFSANLDYDLQGTVVRVFPRRPRTRLFEVNLLPVRRAWNARSGTLVTSAVDSDPFGDIDAGVRALLSQQGRHHIDRRSGLVSVTDFTDRLDQIGLYLEAAQLRATRQVRIEARVLQVVLNDDVWGVDLQALAARGTAGVRQSPSASTGYVVTDFEAFFRALGQWGQVSSAGAPRVLATNNEPALVRVATGSRAATEGGAATDLNLAVTPQVSADGVVLLSLASRYSNAAPAGDLLSSGEADTVVRVRGGETIVISGLQHPATVAAVPRRTEVLVLLTATIVGPTVPSQAGGR